MRYSVRWLAPAFLLLASFTVHAEVPIELASRIPNRPPGRCGWCSLETLARHHRIKPLYGLVEDHPTQSFPSDLEQALDDANVRYRVQARGNFDQDILHDAIRKKLGALVGLRELQPGGGGHIVTLVDFGDETVRIIDPNDADCRIRTLTLEVFLDRWDGYSIVLLKPRKK